jgi:ADP-ribose pyrophosphatase
MDELEPWHTTSSRAVYSNPWMTVREDAVVRPDGSNGIYGVVRLGRCVGMLPFVDDDHVLLVRQWRYITRVTTWEMPTGGMHDDETPVEAVQRELAEEAGVHAGRLESLGSHVTSKSVIDETAHLFLAYDLVPAAAHPDETEFISRHVVSFDQALAWVLDGTIVDSMTIIAVLLAARRREAGQS